MSIPKTIENIPLSSTLTDITVSTSQLLLENIQPITSDEKTSDLPKETSDTETSEPSESVRELISFHSASPSTGCVDNTILYKCENEHEFEQLRKN